MKFLYKFSRENKIAKCVYFGSPENASNNNESNPGLNPKLLHEKINPFSKKNLTIAAVSKENQIKSALDEIADKIKSAQEIGEKFEPPVNFKKIPASNLLSTFNQETLQFMFFQDGKINFHDNKFAAGFVGAGDLFPYSQKYLKINDVLGKRGRYKNKIGYFDSQGNYLPIYGGATGQVQEGIVTTISEEDKNKFETEIKNSKSREISSDLTLEQEQEYQKSFTENLKTREKDLQKRLCLKDAQFTQYVQAEHGLNFPNFTEDNIGKPASQNTLKEKFAKFFPNSSLKFEQAYAFFNAIASQESNNNYQAVGNMMYSGSHLGFRAIGKYQIMADEWSARAVSTIGENVPPTARNQDIIAFTGCLNNLKKWREKGVSIQDSMKLAAVNWYGNNGKTLNSLPDISDKKTTSGDISPKEYSNDILNRTQK